MHREFLSFAAGVALIVACFVGVYGNRLLHLNMPLGYNAKVSFHDSNEFLWRPDFDPATGVTSFNQVDLFPSLSAISRLKTEGSLSSTRLEFPEGFDEASLPTGNTQLGLGIIQFILLFGDLSPAIISNVFFLFMILLIYLAAYISLRSLRIEHWITAFGAAVVALFPHNFGKEPFVNLTIQGLILTIAYAVRLRDDLAKRSNFVKAFALGALNAFSGIYWWCFSSIVMTLRLVVDRLSAVRKSRVFLMWSAIVVPGLLSIICSLWQSRGFFAAHPETRITRSEIDLINWPSRVLDSLVLPTYSPLSIGIFNPQELFGDRTGEGVYTYGPWGMVSLVVACFILANNDTSNESLRSRPIRAASILVVLLHVFSSFGSIPHVITYIAPVIKSWERFQLATMIVSLFLLLLVSDHFAKAGSYAKSLAFLTPIVVGSVLSIPFGVFGGGKAAYARWESTATFFEQIDQIRPGSSVAILPPNRGFESGPVGQIPPYADQLGLIHSRSLRFSTRLLATSSKNPNVLDNLALVNNSLSILQTASLLGYDSIVVDVRQASYEFLLSLKTETGCKTMIRESMSRYIYCEINDFGVFKIDGLLPGTITSTIRR